MMLDDVGWCWMMLDDIGWCWMILDDVGWCWMLTYMLTKKRDRERTPQSIRTWSISAESQKRRGPSPCNSCSVSCRIACRASWCWEASHSLSLPSFFQRATWGLEAMTHGPWWSMIRDYFKLSGSRRQLQEIADSRQIKLYLWIHPRILCSAMASW
jgi:hypothetical protein